MGFFGLTSSAEKGREKERKKSKDGKHQRRKPEDAKNSPSSRREDEKYHRKEHVQKSSHGLRPHRHRPLPSGEDPRAAGANHPGHQRYDSAVAEKLYSNVAWSQSYDDLFGDAKPELPQRHTDHMSDPAEDRTPPELPVRPSTAKLNHKWSQSSTHLPLASSYPPRPQASMQSLSPTNLPGAPSLPSHGYSNTPPPPYTFGRAQPLPHVASMSQLRHPIRPSNVVPGQSAPVSVPASGPPSQHAYYHSSTNFSVPHIAPNTSPYSQQSSQPLRHKPTFQSQQSLGTLNATTVVPMPVKKLPTGKLSSGSGCLITSSMANLHSSINGYLDSVDEMFENVNGLDGAGVRLLDLMLGREGNETGEVADEVVEKEAQALVQSTRSPVCPSKTPIFSKSWYYANARLPPHLPPLVLHSSTWPILNLAATCSRAAYSAPGKHETRILIRASNLKRGPKSMYLTSVVNPHLNIIVLAIRGTKVTDTRDLLVNMATKNESPRGFLDDETNLCHEGFLEVARAMVGPVAKQLRRLLESPSVVSAASHIRKGKKAPSLLITGHSAGGAVSALLHAHIFSTSPSCSSALTKLKDSFRHIQCVTFGCPPLSVTPLVPSYTSGYSHHFHRPGSSRIVNKNFHLAILNEGDPVPRLSPPMLLTLSKLWLAPRPAISPPVARAVPKNKLKVPGRIVVLRTAWDQPNGTEVGPRGSKGVQAVVLDGLQSGERGLEGLVWGDMQCHKMKLYEERIGGLTKGAMFMGS